MPTANAHAYQGQQQSIVKTSNMFVLMRTTWNSYLSLLNRYPMATQMVQAGVLMSAGDVISQVALEKQTGKMDTERTLRFAGLGVFLIVSILHRLTLVEYPYFKSKRTQRHLPSAFGT